MLNANQIKELTNLLSLTWHGDEKMIKYCLKSSKYIQIGNMFVNCCGAKPSISKTMYYDDETEGPDVNLESFKHYNELNFPRLYKLENRCNDLHFVINYNGDKTDGKLVTISYIDESFKPLSGTLRKVTPEELGQINEAIEEVRKDYDKRLNSYYKRYSDKISTVGYWANR